MNLFKKILPYFIFLFFSSAAFERGLFVIFFMENGHSFLDISILQITLFLSNMAFEIPTGYFADRFGRKNSLIIGSLLMSMSVYFQYQGVDHFFYLMLSMIGLGASFAFISGSMLAILYDHLKELKEEKSYPRIVAWSRIISSLSLGLSIAGGAFLWKISWFWVYTATSVFVLFSIFPIYFMDKSKVKKEYLEKIRFTHAILEVKHLFKFIIPFSLMHGAMTPYFIYSQKIFQENGFDISEIPLWIAIAEILGACFSYFFLAKIKHGQTSISNLSYLFIVLSLCFVLNLFVFPVLSIICFLTANLLVLYLHCVSEDFFQGKIKKSIHRASVLSMITFFDATFIGFGYLMQGYLGDIFSPSKAMSFFFVLPLLAFFILRNILAAERLAKSVQAIAI